MKQTLQLSRFVRSTVLITALLMLAAHVTMAQCCLTNSLTINTGWDPVTSNTVTPGANGGAAVTDPKWTVCSISSQLITNIGSMPAGYYAVTPTSAADVVQSYTNTTTAWNWATSGVSNYISCLNSNTFILNPPNYDNNFKVCRQFNTCDSTCISFDFYVAVDNWIENMNLDGVFVYAQTPGTSNSANFTHVVPSGCFSVGPGLHTISITVAEDSATGDNEIGINLNGTISAPTNTIYKENSTCTYFQCVEPPIIGLDTMCGGTTITLIDSEAGGIWTSSNTVVATVSGVITGTISNGIVTASLSGGTTIITYTDPCGRAMYDTITVLPGSSAGTITGTPTLCVGAAFTFTDPSAGAGIVWTSSNSGVAAITGPTTGLSTDVTGVGVGTAVISVKDSNSCGVTTASYTVTVYPVVSATITGTAGMCVGTAETLTVTGTMGGLWSSGTPSVATVSSTVSGIGTEVITAVSAGTAIISYVVSSPCNTVIATFTITVSPPVYAGTITGTNTICAFSTTTLTTTGTVGAGAWSYTPPPPTIITIAPTTGTVTAVTGWAVGTSVVTFTASNFCGADTTYDTITVLPGVSATITGTPTLCVGSSETLTATGSLGTTWSWGSISPSVISVIDPASGAIIAINYGTSIITYTTANACDAVTAYFTVFVPFPPTASITGSPSLCIHSNPGRRQYYRWHVEHSARYHSHNRPYQRSCYQYIHC